MFSSCVCVEGGVFPLDCARYLMGEHEVAEKDRILEWVGSLSPFKIWLDWRPPGQSTHTDLQETCWDNCAFATPIWAEKKEVHNYLVLLCSSNDSGKVIRDTLSYFSPIAYAEISTPTCSSLHAAAGYTCITMSKDFLDTYLWNRLFVMVHPESKFWKEGGIEPAQTLSWFSMERVLYKYRFLFYI